MSFGNDYQQWKRLPTIVAISCIFSCSFLGDGNATFTNKFVQTNYYKDSLSQGDIATYTMFAAPDPPFSTLNTLISLIKGLDNTNVNIVKIGQVSYSFCVCNCPIDILGSVGNLKLLFSITGNASYLRRSTLSCC